MLDTIRKYWSGRILLLLFLFFTAWWAYMTFFLKPDSPFYSYYGTFYAIIAFWGGIWGIYISKQWGGLKSLMGKAILMFALGLFAQVFGQIAYSYYIFVLHIDIPYPSIGDIGFFGTIPFYIYAALLIARVSGVHFSLRSIRNKILAVLVPLVILIIAYALILRNYSLDFTKPIETFLNFGYPTGQAIYISIALLTYSLTRKLLGGVMKPKILLIIIAFAAQFLSDYIFIYFKNQYYPGSIIDYFYTVAYFIMALAILDLQTVLFKIKKS